ncbi:MAG: hypothetical protein WBC05_00380 [Sedimentisphaerales bacterium]
MFSMFRKMICLASFVLVMGLVGNVSADVSWNDSTNDHLWSTLANWATGTVPTPADGYVRIGMVPGPTIANEGAVAGGIHLGIGSNAGELTVDGGTLTVDGGAFNLGYTGSGTLNMTDGTITLTNVLKIARDPTAIGHVNLDGGIISTNNFVMREKEGSVGTMVVRAGTLIINGDRLSLVQGYIDQGWITAYDGNGTLNLDYDVTNEGRTTLSATHMLNPNPVNGGLVSPGEMELSWTLSDPCVPGQPVLVDVYFTDDLQLLEWFTDPAAIQIVSKQNVTSAVVQTQPKTWYYWAVDTYIGAPNDPVFGPIFSFFADNMPPEVDAGTDVVTWLVDGVMTKNLDATVTDDEAYTVQWTVLSEPNDPNSPDAVITDPSAEDTSITLSAVGEYVLQLEAFDGEYTGSGTVPINVYNNGCEAARSLPDYVPFPGDLNGDCRVDDLDLAILEKDWLKDNSLTEP